MGESGRVQDVELEDTRHTKGGFSSRQGEAAGGLQDSVVDGFGKTSLVMGSRGRAHAEEPMGKALAGVHQGPRGAR